MSYKAESSFSVSWIKHSTCENNCRVFQSSLDSEKIITEAKKSASILGYNYGSGEWYERSYKVFNKKYKPIKIKKEKKMGLIRRKIKTLFE